MTTRLGYWDTDSDRQRLQRQEQGLAEATERLLRRAGVGPGMRVLDVGTGVGGVAFIAAKLVGPTGYALGVDYLPASIETARARARESGLANVDFEVADFHDLTPAEPFDAAVARLVLQYQADPVESLRRMASCVRPGGVVACYQGNMLDHNGDVTHTWWPRSPNFGKAMSFYAQVLAARGVQPLMGLRLVSCMLAAGLEPSPDTEGMISMRAGEGAGGFLPLLKNAFEDARELGIEPPEGLALEGFAERVEREVAPEVFVWTSPISFAVWARRP